MRQSNQYEKHSFVTIEDKANENFTRVTINPVLIADKMADYKIYLESYDAASSVKSTLRTDTIELILTNSGSSIDCN